MLLCTSIVFLILTVDSGLSSLFHEASRMVFKPNVPASYFGYSLLLRDTKPIQLIVGAPKAKNVVKNTSPGAIFTCPLDFMDGKPRNVTCESMKLSAEYRNFRSYSGVDEFYKDDMWLGASLAAVSNGSLLVGAPRWTKPYSNKHLSQNGLCFVVWKNKYSPLLPLDSTSQIAFLTDGSRTEYAGYGSHLYYYMFGQAAMSITVTEDQKTVMMGAPGLLDWTGGVIYYQLLATDLDLIYFRKLPIVNPYYTTFLGPNELFGYSVASGVFEKNGKTLFVAGAPRSKSNFGQVIIFNKPNREREPLSVYKSLTGPQLGAYFGASLCVVDLDFDGISDVLVGAPNYVQSKGDIPFDQGAVFVYLTRTGATINMELSGVLMGSRENGARFGTSIASLGDIDDDGFQDIAVGAPFENEGLGTVYIYRGYKNGLNKEYAQRITALNSAGFGIAISKGLDVDGNGCNELAVGAFKSEKVYVYRCLPTIKIKTSIRVPDAMDLPQNATNFTAHFCVDTEKTKRWSHIKLALSATVSVDKELNRATLSGDENYVVSASPGEMLCEELVIEVKPRVDLSKPITILFSLKPEKDKAKDMVFSESLVRLSEDSLLNSSLDIQLTMDCGEDLTCLPLLELTLLPISSTYIPGLTNTLGANVTVFNLEEPAYGFKVMIFLPMEPKRVPVSCTLKDFNMTCNLPNPLYRNESVSWPIELDYTENTTGELVLPFRAVLIEPLELGRNETNPEKEIRLIVKPKANITISSKALPNDTLPVTRKTFNDEEMLTMTHSFELTNNGPSNWLVKATISLQKEVTLSNEITSCDKSIERLECVWFLPANVSKHLPLQLKFNLSKYGDLLSERGFLQLSTLIVIEEMNRTATTTTNFILDPSQPIWPILVGIIAGLILLSGIIYFLYKHNFFTRKRVGDLKDLQENIYSEPDEASGSSQSPQHIDESTQGLLFEDSD